MALLLSRLGRTAFRRRRLVLTIWILLLAVVGLGAVTLSQPSSGSFSIPGSESQKAIDLLQQRLPDADGASGRIVFADKDEAIDASGRRAITQALALVAGIAGVSDVTDPFAGGALSRDGRVALAQVTFTQSSSDLGDDARRGVQEAADRARAAGLRVEYGGDVVVPPADSPLGEVIGVPVAALVLFVTFGSLLAAGMPLLTALISVSTGLAAIIASTHFFDLDSAALTVALMLGLAVGIDYAVFILSRHRSQLQQGLDPEDSVALAIGTAGSAVVFAGATVVIALTALSVIGIPFLTAMGLAAAGTVAIAVLVAVTLVPALLGFAGHRIARGRKVRPQRAAAPVTPSRPPMGSRWATWVTRHRRGTVIAVVVGLAGCAIPVLGIHLGMPDDSTAAPGTTNRAAYDLVSGAFGPGFSGPLTIVVDGEGRSAGGAARAVATQLKARPDVADMREPVLSDQGDTAIVSVIPRSGPSTQATRQLVHSVRAQAPALERSYGAEILVTGQTAVNIDIADKLGSAMVPFLAVIVGLALILLMVAFRSVLVPLTAIGGFLLTIAAAFGGVVAIFQKGWGAKVFGIDQQAPVVSLLPIIGIAILFGLAMDYQVFLVSRMREEHRHGADPISSIIRGFSHSARVVTAAALIMAAVFSGFILGHDMIIKSVGFTLAFGILVDAFLIRMTLIPALMALMGERAWWLPGWLDRLLPDVDIEGLALEPRVAGADPHPAPVVPAGR
jgi:RND superfamily putative drug exporter